MRDKKSAQYWRIDLKLPEDYIKFHHSRDIGKINWILAFINGSIVMLGAVVYASKQKGNY
jgi:hypothetical protein